jgi:hypothetical protein
MFYSGSNIYAPGGLFYAHGLGHATSSDGVNWIQDPGNPIFSYDNGVAWRNGRTYTPFVLNQFCGSAALGNTFKMWFTGGSGDTQGVNQAVGYATLSCGLLPVPSVRITPLTLLPCSLIPKCCVLREEHVCKKTKQSRKRHCKTQINTRT